MKYVIRESQTSKYYLSHQKDVAVAMIFGYGGVWTANPQERALFDTIELAQKEIDKMTKTTRPRAVTIEKED